ncbi:hypothetical protein ACX1HG_02600 [Yersinia enterocolitica]|uniref:hypothetical protein n=1 Tax=Yersinia enterocolitica TaxID=630 RepID=UPI0032FF7A0E|nr:hypothetical protein [Yersinia enterocolitica]EKN6054875.1 hypothetical protein [Yersinia enterocolitica]HDL6924843.1 hypothetical protein [Yersinia enterocolitica]HDL7428368.1 hypothetical protein [Yersinia enterocolitica]HDL7431944.1 hypothetical protein [Yersinia enterocolitica]
MLSKEQLEKIANQEPVDIGGAQNPIVTEMAAELLSLREQLEAIKSQKPSYWLGVHRYQTYLYFNEKDATEECDKNGGLYVKPVYDGPTVAVAQNIKAIEDNLIEQVGLMCDRAVNIHEKNIYGGAFCVLKYGIIPYLRKQKVPPATELF